MSVGESAVSFPRVAVTCHAYVRRAFGRSANGCSAVFGRRCSRGSSRLYTVIRCRKSRRWRVSSLFSAGLWCLSVWCASGFRAAVPRGTFTDTVLAIDISEAMRVHLC